MKHGCSSVFRSPTKGAVSVSKIIYSPVFESNLAPLNQGQYSPIT